MALIAAISFLNRVLTHIVKCRDAAVSCAKTAEPIEVHLGMWTWLGPGNTYCMGM